ncbi:indoleamine 2,3-dioxygenase family protein [Didymella exigua CBS 183.55]|uniref:Indoleamine 2,3-dioxygenase n=1 Tax=Didymella exigua CBS 183.55 TaxID=1150837 RepID=A0A6A5S0G6_9PLEO|nr:indoleamine 2,3-dioxygenase family protein [Didymella exigua CBS 183.55]KAF1931007.1 indoleamine 2,3-dioxygenase family protein [Didymella exigua CBS 183.55]
MSPHKVEALPSAAALPSYGISKNGFLPASAPLTRLPNDYYLPWESIVEVLPTLIETRQIRQRVDELPILDTAYLKTEAEWQRAYSMLAVITQGYVWQGPEPSERLPPTISVPFLKAAEHLEVHPIATYAALNLWNWRPLEKGANITQPDNLVALHTATGSDDESWFLIISNAMEARAGPLLHIMLAAMEAVEHNDVPAIVSGLRYFTESMKDIGRLLERMDERCNPQRFYYTIRPLLAGSMNMEAAGLPNGVFYDEGNGKGQWRKYRGGSNGQSSLLQFFDAALSVNHTRCGNFHAEMREYMPGPHKRFLDDIESIANIRSYVDSHQEDTELLEAYNEAIAALSRFRDIHIALVTRFIIIPARQGRPAQFAERNDIASMSTKMAAEKGQVQELVGTGGTKLIPFLRTSRDETKEANVS